MYKNSWKKLGWVDVEVDATKKLFIANLKE